MVKKVKISAPQLSKVEFELFTAKLGCGLVPGVSVVHGVGNMIEIDMYKAFPECLYDNTEINVVLDRLLCLLGGDVSTVAEWVIEEIEMGVVTDLMDEPGKFGIFADYIGTAGKSFEGTVDLMCDIPFTLKTFSVIDYAKENHIAIPENQPEKMIFAISWDGDELTTVFGMDRNITVSDLFDKKNVLKLISGFESTFWTRNARRQNHIFEVAYEREESEVFEIMQQSKGMSKDEFSELLDGYNYSLCDHVFEVAVGGLMKTVQHECGLARVDLG